ncbi:MAG TPA: S-layer homology domain-containing protein [Chthonomonadaceae bacterium]|nr:S-layer homology domain-containing protein [Chthonomonadaceae bacterium]
MKRMYGAWLLYALACVIALSTRAAAQNANQRDTDQFVDVPKNHWAYDAVLDLKRKGILIGYPGPLPRMQGQTPEAAAPQPTGRSARSDNQHAPGYLSRHPERTVHQRGAHLQHGKAHRALQARHKSGS